MNPSDPFHGAVLKTKWANEHIQGVSKAIFDAFFVSRADSYEIIVDDNGEAHDVEKHPFIGRVPEEVFERSSYALYNLRSALDHVACAISTAARRSKADFIVGDDVNEFERAIEQAEKKRFLSPDASGFIRSFRPYLGGNGEQLFWVLHRLNIIDKHRTLMTSALYGHRRTVGDFSPVDFAAVKWERLDEGSQIGGGTDSHPKTQTLMNVAFDQVEIIKHEPVITVLRDLTALVWHVITRARKEFPGASVPPL